MENDKRSFIDFGKIGWTGKAIEIYKRYKEAFGEVVKAEMKSIPKEIKFELTLTNTEGEKMVFKGPLTSGYLGEGSDGTYRVLLECGFDITDKFVENNANFTLNREP